MTVKKIRKKVPIGTIIAHLLSFVFLLLMVVYYCLELDIEKETLFFNFALLPRCLPFVLFYLVLELWLFPMYIRSHRVGRYIIMSLGFMIIIPVLCCGLMSPLFPASNTEMKKTQSLTDPIYLDSEGQRMLIDLVDSDSMNGRQVVDSCVNYTHVFFGEEPRQPEETLPLFRIIICSSFCLVLFMVYTTINVLENSYRVVVERRRIEQEKVETELRLLRYQLNPHFLMNTLNNIHALIEDDSEAAQKAVRLLSKMMRYMYYDNSQERVDLAKDVDVLNSYFELMKLRFIDSVDLQFKMPSSIPNVKVAPSLFVNLAENAMKHGISYGHPSYVHFTLEVDDAYICCQVRNSKFDHVKSTESTGFGLEALKKRLDILYPDQYSYTVEDSENEYFVELKIPIQ